MSNDTPTKFSLIDLPEIPDSVDNALQNLTDVPSKNVGQTLGDLWYLVFGGISHAVNKRKMKYAHDLAIYNQELNVAIDQIPEEHRLEPSIQVTAQALENSKYCISEPELRKMFVNLISNSMDKRFSDSVHPSFPEIIKQMSPLDALLLNSFNSLPRQPIVNYVMRYQDQHTKLIEPYVFFDSNGCHSPLYASSISSLERFGLLLVDFTRCISKDSLYNIFSDWTHYKDLANKLKNPLTGEYVDIEKGFCSLTPLGQSFLKACLF